MSKNKKSFSFSGDPPIRGRALPLNPAGAPTPDTQRSPAPNLPLHQWGWSMETVGGRGNGLGMAGKRGTGRRWEGRAF